MCRGEAGKHGIEGEGGRGKYGILSGGGEIRFWKGRGREGGGSTFE